MICNRLNTTIQKYYSSMSEFIQVVIKATQKTLFWVSSLINHTHSALSSRAKTSEKVYPDYQNIIYSAKFLLNQSFLREWMKILHQYSRIKPFLSKNWLIVKVRIYASQQNLCIFGNVSSTVLYNHFINYCYLKHLFSSVIFFNSYYLQTTTRKCCNK